MVKVKNDFHSRLDFIHIGLFVESVCITRKTFKDKHGYLPQTRQIKKKKRKKKCWI